MSTGANHNVSFSSVEIDIAYNGSTVCESSFSVVADNSILSEFLEAVILILKIIQSGGYFIRS